MPDDWVDDTNAIFTSSAIARDWREEGGDSHPPPGREFVLALGAAFLDAGWQVSQMDPDCTDPKSLWWEHSYWFLFLGYREHSFFVQLEPIPETGLWRIGFSLRRGCLPSLFGDHRKSLLMPGSLRAQVTSIIERAANTTDIRWVSDEEAMALW